MTKRIFFLVPVAVLACSGIWAAGCGSDNGGTDAGTDGTAPTDGSMGGDAACTMTGTACGSSGECCSGNCASGVCASPIGMCKPANSACTNATECCSLSCLGGFCQTKCVSDNQACTQDAECCGQVCGPNKTCTPLNGSCKTSGNACTQNGECCSKVCNGGICLSQVSFCGQTGDICQQNSECCGNICTKSGSNPYGVCGVPAAPGGTMCDIAGIVCGTFDGDAGVGDSGLPPCGGSCCSRACAPSPTVKGINICQPPSGCKPTGEICGSGKDCCGSKENPGGANGSVTCSKEPADAGAGRCDNGTACRPAGAICKLAISSCNAENNCCAGNVNQNPLVCQQDLLGIPRCTAVGQCQDAGVSPDGGSLAGQGCSTSADCCGLPCLPNLNGNPPFICGPSCVPQGGTCSTSGDCCKGIPCTNGKCEYPGSDGGTFVDGGTPMDAGCALYGQLCSVNGDCCNGIPCTGGRCFIPPN